MTTVIQAEGLGKRYRRGAIAQRGMLRDTLTRAMRSPLSVLRRSQHETFWALKDVSLGVHEGEVLGLIGRNGAGKTTLLKILSRITRPTTGWAEIRGRVRSLLEVGTGVHPELSGRENTYLSGSILWMSKRESDRKFDEIVAWVDGGSIRQTGPTHEVVSAYESAMSRGENGHGGNAAERPASKGRFVRWEVVEPRGEEGHILSGLGPTTVKFMVKIDEAVRAGHHGCALFNHERELIWAWSTDDVKLEVGEHEFRYTFPMLPVRPGPYCWQVSLYDEGEQLDPWDCVPEMIMATEGHQHTDDEWNGVLNIPSRFEIDYRG